MFGWFKNFWKTKKQATFVLESGAPKLQKKKVIRKRQKKVEEIQPELFPAIQPQFAKQNLEFSSVTTEFVNPKFPTESISLIKELVLKTPDLSQAVKRMLTLGNTGIEWTVEGAKEKETEEIYKEIDKFFEQRPFIINKLLRQIIVTGALSAEFIPSENFDSVEEIQIIPTDKIVFKLEKLKNYIAYQPYYKSSNGYIPLNSQTYTYDPIETDEDSPYAIPLFLSAVPSILANHKITENTASLIEKWGLLGFITLVKKRPNPLAGEDAKSYETRLMEHLQSIKKAFEENKNTGFIAAFDDTKIDHHSIATSDHSTGYEKIYRAIEEQVASGLDIDPAMLGRTYSTTETYAGMVYNAFISKLNNIRTPIKKFLLKVLKFHLTAKGFQFSNLTGKWGESYAIDRKNLAEVEKVKAEAEKIKVETLTLLYNQGIIDNTIFAKEMGYEKPVSLQPQSNQPKLEVLEVQEVKKKLTHKHSCCSLHDLVKLGVWEEKQRKIYEAIEENFTSQFFKSYEQKVYSTLESISKLDISNKEASEFILQEIERELGVNFTNSQKEKFLEVLNEAWKLGQDYSKGPNPNALALDFNKEARNFFEKLLKVDVGGQFKNSKNDFLSAIQEGLKTGDINTVIQNLEEKLLGKLDSEGKRQNSEIINKLDYIVRDNIYRSQNFSRSLRMQEEGIYRVQIVAILDQKTSEICRSLNGKTVELKTINTYIREFLGDNPERAGFWQDRKNPSDYAAKQMGFDKMSGDEILEKLGHKAPPFHIRCRTTLVASFDIIAHSTKEAESIAKLEFGVDAKFGGNENLKLANHINQGLRYAKDRGRIMPEQIVMDSILVEKIFKEVAKDIPAAFLEPENSPSGRKTILINNKNSYWNDPKASSNEDFNNKLITTNNMYHVILHELAHLEHFQKNEPLYRRKMIFEDRIIKEKICELVSELASLNSREFVAEIKVGLLHGKKYPDEMMELYFALGGE